jgi:hypothetical protein
MDVRTDRQTDTVDCGLYGMNSSKLLSWLIGTYRTKIEIDKK